MLDGIREWSGGRGWGDGLRALSIRQSRLTHRAVSQLSRTYLVRQGVCSQISQGELESPILASKLDLDGNEGIRVGRDIGRYGGIHRHAEVVDDEAAFRG